MNNSYASYFPDPELVVTIRSIVKMILVKRLIRGDPMDIEIVRVKRPSVFPCRRSYGPEPLDISQLDEATEKGEFWFLGPIKSLNISLGNTMEGQLELGVNNVLTYNTHLNTLNFKDFMSVAERIKETANELGLKAYFEGDPSKYQHIRLFLSAEKPLSEHNVRDFIDAVQKVISTNYLE